MPALWKRSTSSGCVCAVQATIGMPFCLACSRMSFVAATPSMIGIEMSINITSNLSRSKVSIAIFPFTASMIRCPSFTNNSRNTNRLISLPSTIKILRERCGVFWGNLTGSREWLGVIVCIGMRTQNVLPAPS